RIATRTLEAVSNAQLLGSVRCRVICRSYPLFHRLRYRPVSTCKAFGALRLGLPSGSREPTKAGRRSATEVENFRGSKKVCPPRRFTAIVFKGICLGASSRDYS